MANDSGCCGKLVVAATVSRRALFCGLFRACASSLSLVFEPGLHGSKSMENVGRQCLSVDLHSGEKMSEGEKSIDRRARATKFLAVQYYATSLTYKEFKAFAPGLYKIAAENAEIYVIDGAPGSFTNAYWSRIEGGDWDVWECRDPGDILSVYLSSGAAVRITKRSAG